MSGYRPSRSDLNLDGIQPRECLSCRTVFHLTTVEFNSHTKDCFEEWRLREELERWRKEKALAKKLRRERERSISKAPSSPAHSGVSRASTELLGDPYGYKPMQPGHGQPSSFKSPATAALSYIPLPPEIARPSVPTHPYAPSGYPHQDPYSSSSLSNLPSVPFPVGYFYPEADSYASPSPSRQRPSPPRRLSAPPSAQGLHVGQPGYDSLTGSYGIHQGDVGSRPPYSSSNTGTGSTHPPGLYGDTSWSSANYYFPDPIPGPPLPPASESHSRVRSHTGIGSTHAPSLYESTPSRHLYDATPSRSFAGPPLPSASLGGGSQLTPLTALYTHPPLDYSHGREAVFYPPLPGQASSSGQHEGAEMPSTPPRRERRRSLSVLIKGAVDSLKEHVAPQSSSAQPRSLRPSPPSQKISESAIPYSRDPTGYRPVHGSEYFPGHASGSSRAGPSVNEPGPSTALRQPSTSSHPAQPPRAVPRLEKDGFTPELPGRDKASRPSGNKPFICQKPGCSSAYSTLGNLARHRKTDHAANPPSYTCACGRSYKHKHHLDRHKKDRCTHTSS